MKVSVLMLACIRASASDSCDADETTLLQGLNQKIVAHEVADTPVLGLLNHDKQCWFHDQCNRQGGYCPDFCGIGRCCRLGHIYSERERAECGDAGVGQPNMHTCQPPELVQGGNDGSCPAGSTRVSPDACPTLSGLTLDDGSTNGKVLSNRRHRVDCAEHFVAGEGCFYNPHGDVYSTGANCAAAEELHAYWATKHYAVCARGHLVHNFGQAGGGNSCPGGSDVNEDDCLEAAKSLLSSKQPQGRPHLVAGSWGWVPPGCSVQTHRTRGRPGDFAAHYNRGNGNNDGGYTKVCATSCQHLHNQDVVAGTFEHYGLDHGGSASDAACSAACTADEECTAWVRQPSSGRCWISRQAVVTFEADTDRTTGLRCNN